MSKKASKNGPKGKSKPAQKQITIADSLSQAGSMLDLPVRLLQAAKCAGCGGFRGGRVHLVEVKAWLDVPENMAKLRDQVNEIERVELDILKQKLRLITLRADVALGAVISLSDVRQAVMKLVTVAKSKLLDIPTSAAPYLVGKDMPTIAEELKRALCAALHEIQVHPWNNQEVSHENKATEKRTSDSAR